MTEATENGKQVPTAVGRIARGGPVYGLVAGTIALCGILSACGPSCLEVVTSLDEAAALAGDVARVNGLVARRKAAMEDAKSGAHDAFGLERLKFSVTAFELAIEAQLRVIKVSPKYEDADIYGEQQQLIARLRCSLEELLEDDGHLVSDGEGRGIQQLSAEIGQVFRTAGTLSKQELKTYLEEGIPIAIAAPEPAQPDAESSTAADDGDEAADDAKEDDPAVFSEAKDDGLLD